MSRPDKKCPRCGLWNSASALVCDCGFEFKSGQVTFWIWIAGAVAIAGLYLWFNLPR